jgi:hypothetical protein
VLKKERSTTNDIAKKIDSLQRFYEENRAAILGHLDDKKLLTILLKNKWKIFSLTLFSAFPQRRGSIGLLNVHPFSEVQEQVSVE